MAWEPRDGDGSLFPNDRKTGKQPDMSGNIIAHRDVKAGEAVNLAGWWKGGSEGRAQFLSLKMSDVRAASNEPPELDDSVPW